MTDVPEADIPNEIGGLDAEAREEARRNNEANGLAPKSLTRNATDADAKAWTDAAVQAVRLAAHPQEIREWGELHNHSMAMLAEHHFEEWQRLVVELDAIQNALSARLN